MFLLAATSRGRHLGNGGDEASGTEERERRRGLRRGGMGSRRDGEEGEREGVGKWHKEESP